MPTYEYECAHCEQRFEAFQRMSDPPLCKCPHCNSKKVRRLIGNGAGIIFKGSGFYETDYKHGKDYREAARNDKEKPAEAKGADTKAAASDTKPAKKDKQ